MSGRMGSIRSMNPSGHAQTLTPFKPGNVAARRHGAYSTRFLSEGLDLFLVGVGCRRLCRSPLLLKGTDFLFQFLHFLFQGFNFRGFSGAGGRTLRGPGGIGGRAVVCPRRKEKQQPGKTY